MQARHCPRGVVVEAEVDDALVEKVEQHMQSKHPDHVGKSSREQILSTAEES